jgi:GDP-4-dehydro-6-deoxy-D-mannose reductase
MRTLVTGVTGFAGGYLAEALLARRETDLYGLSRRGEWPAEWQHLVGRVALTACDLTESTAVEKVLRQVRPQRIYHLAGYPHVGQSFREPDAAWAGNLNATRALYEAVDRWGGKPRILFIGSGLVYGPSDMSDEAQDEYCLLRPYSPYAASKAAADLVSYQFTCNPGLDIVRVRPYNHVGPRQSPQFAIPHFAKQLAAIERGLSPPVLQTGNLSPRRDLTDVRDMVNAYLLLMDKGRTGEAYNIGSGQTVSIQYVVDRLRALSGLTVEVRQRAELVRAKDQDVVRADATKVRQETGWSPRYSLDQTLKDTLQFWREQPVGAAPV